MSGFRIHHPTARNCRILVHHPGEIKQSIFKTLNKGRRPKDYHIIVDNEGNCIVSETVLERLREVKANFLVLNEVADPPTQTISNNDTEVHNVEVVREIEGALKRIAPPGITSFNLKKHKVYVVADRDGGIYRG